MKLNTLEDHLKLEGGIKIDQLEPILVQIITLLYTEGTNWKEGIAIINKVLHLKEHDDTRISPNTAQLILSWINEHYSSTIFQELDAFEELGLDEKSNVLHETIRLTFDTLSLLSKVIPVLPLLEEKLANAVHEYEKELLHDEIKYIPIFNSTNKQTISLSIKRQIEARANQYLNSDNRSENQCALIESITEHEYSYSLGWCLASEKYISPVKRTMFGGGGPLYVSKISDAIDMGYYDPYEDSLVNFELKIRNLEGYWCLEIEYNKKHISHLKAALQLTTTQLLGEVDEKGMISREGDQYELNPLKEELEHLSINCALIHKERPITV